MTTDSPADQLLADLPKYLREGLPKQGDNDLEAIREWIDEELERRAQAPTDDELPDARAAVSGNGADVVDAMTDDERSQADLSKFHGTFQWEFGECGKDGCACHSGDESGLHGPYLYRYYRKDGRLRDEYVKTGDRRYRTYVPRSIPRPETPADARKQRARAARTKTPYSGRRRT